MNRAEILERALEAVDERSQAELARRLHRSDATVSRWFRPVVPTDPDYASALGIARLTDLDPVLVLQVFGHDPTLLPVRPSGAAGPARPEPIRRLEDNWEKLPPHQRAVLEEWAHEAERTSPPGGKRARWQAMRPNARSRATLAPVGAGWAARRGGMPARAFRGFVPDAERLVG